MSVAIRAWSCMAVVCMLSGAGHATRPRPPDPADAVSEGRLVTQRGGVRVDVPLQHTDVKITVDGFLAEATVTQRFKNPYPSKIEAVYLFPLPTGAAVSALQITSGDRVIEGIIQERRQATRTYEAARAQGQIAALLTQERPNLFTQSVANLEPNAAIDVTLHYVQRLSYDGGGYEVVFPMVAGPRYMPAAAAGKLDPAAVQPAVLPAGVRSSHDIGLAVELDAGVPLGDIASSSHRIAIERVPGAPGRARVQIAPDDTIPNKDFILRYQVAGAAPAFGALAYRSDPGKDGSFVLVAQPPAAAAPAQIAPREIVFVLDTSSSMRGAPLAKAKEVIRAVLARLRPDDTFQIVRFDDRASALGASPIANKPRNVELTLAWLAALDAGGATEMTAGIAAALAVPHDPQRLRIVAFLTDGYVGDEDDVIRLIAERAGDARLFAFGVGTAVNRYLLEEVAVAGRGAAQFVRPDEPTAPVVAAFEQRIDAPVLTDVAIDWGGLAVSDVTPRALPDLFVGQPLAVSGHYARAGRATVTIRGRQAGRDVSFAVPVVLPERAGAHPAIATVWARERIAELSRRLVRKADPEIERQIIELSIASRVLTQLTAFVAVDRSRVTAGGTPVRVAVPVEVPDAVAGIAAGGVYSVSGYGVGGGGTGWGTIGLGSYGTLGTGSGTSVGHGYSVSAGRAAVAIPTVTIGAPTLAADEIGKPVIRRYVRRQLNQIRYCYDKRLISRPTLAGTLTVHFTIRDNGRVVAATADGLGDAEVEACVAGVIQAIEFPRSDGGGVVQINYPFELHPGKEPSP
jgi:Ca-activated chloride channel family protein